MQLERVHLGRPTTWTDRRALGEANVSDEATLIGSNVSINRVVLHTRDEGRIELEVVKELGPIIERREGGPIEINHAAGLKP